MTTFDAITADLNRALAALHAAGDAIARASGTLHTSPHDPDLLAALNAARATHEIARAAYIAARTTFNEIINSTP